MNESARLYPVGETAESRTLLLFPEAHWVTETPTGLVFELDTPIEVWGDLVTRLQRQQKVIEWALADAINFGEQAFGEDHAQWVDETGLAKRTLQNIARIGREISAARRRADISFSHHAEVITLPENEQEKLLDRAESAGMTRYDLRDAVRERKRQMAGQAVTAEGEPVCLAEAPWKPGREDLTDEARSALDYRSAQMGRRHAIGFEAGWVKALLWAEQRDCFREWPDE